MSAGTVTQVTTGKRGIDGGIYVAPSGTSLPTTATETLNSAFKNIGYISEDGITNNNAPDTEKLKAWGGQTVLVLTNEKTDEWTMTMIESMNKEVLKIVYGDDNVTENGSGMITVKATAEQLDDASYVIDMVMKGGALKRVVIPNGSLSDLGEITYKDNEAVGYEITINALPDSYGVSHYEYIMPTSST